MRNKIRIGIIGFGTVGKRRFELLIRDPNYEVAAVCDPADLNEFKNIAIPVYNDYKRLIEESLDAVVVSTPNNVSAEIVVSALKEGLHVFCEKPPGRNLTDVQAVIDEEKKHASLKLKYGFNHRYHESVREAKSIIDNKRLGDVLSIKGTYGKSGGKDFDSAWRTKRKIAGGGILLDQGIHMLDLFRWFCGEFFEYFSFIQNNFWEHDVEDNAFAIMKNAQSQVALIHSSATLWKHTFAMDITLTEGYLKLTGMLSGTMSYGREKLTVGYRQFEDEAKAMGNPREEIIYYDKDNSWKDELDEFARCILGDKPVVMGNSRDALKTMEMVYKIYKADREWSKRWNIE